MVICYVFDLLIILKLLQLLYNLIINKIIVTTASDKPHVINDIHGYLNVTKSNLYLTKNIKTDNSVKIDCTDIFSRFYQHDNNSVLKSDILSEIYTKFDTHSSDEYRDMTDTITKMVEIILDGFINSNISKEYIDRSSYIVIVNRRDENILYLKNGVISNHQALENNLFIYDSYIKMLLDKYELKTDIIKPSIKSAKNI